MKKYQKFAAAVCAAALAVTGCNKKAPDTIKIGVFEPLTGANAAGGALEVEGIKLANEMYPAVRVGDREYKVELVIADNKSDKVEAANAVQRLVDKDKVKVILGSWGSSLSMAAGPIAQEAQVPAIGLSCTNPLVTAGNDYYFRVCFIDPFQGTVMAKYAAGELGAKTAAIVQEVSNDYSVGLAKFFVDAFTGLTGNSAAILAEPVNYNTGDQDFTAQLTTLKSLNPDVIFAPGNFTESALLIIQAKQVGITAPFLGGDTWETPDFLDIGKDAVEGATFSTFFDVGGATGGIAKVFVDAYRKKKGEDPAAVTALGFDGYRLALDAIERAGSLETTEIRNAIAETAGFEGAAGLITLDANGDATKSAYIKTVKAGVFSFLTIVNP